MRQHGSEASGADHSPELPDAGIAGFVGGSGHEEDDQRLVKRVAHVDPERSTAVNLDWSNKVKSATAIQGLGGGSIAKWIAYLLADPAAPGLNHGS